MTTVDYSGLAAPTWFSPPTQNPFVPPRTDKGETEERLAFIVPTIEILDTPLAEDEKKLRLPQSVIPPKRVTLKQKEKLEKRTPRKKSNIGLSKVTNFGIRRSSEHRIILNKDIDARLVKSTQNLDLNSLVETIHTQAEFEERLKHQESLVSTLQKQVETCSDTEEKDILSDKLIEQVTLLSEIRMHVKIMKDCHFKGYLEMRIVDPNFDTQLVPFARYWFYLNFPRLCCYENEGDETPSGAIPLSSEMQVIPSPTDKKAFSIVPPGSFSNYEFVAEKVNTATMWKRALCKAANIPLGNVEATHSNREPIYPKELKSDKPDKSYMRRMRSALRLGSAGSSKECRCYSKDEFMTWTDCSSLLETQISKDNELSVFCLTGGILKDFFFWILYHYPIWESSHDNPDLVAFFLSVPNFADSIELIQALFDAWKYFEDNGFPPEISAVGMKKRLFHVVKQWLNSQITFLDITTEVDARKTMKEFVCRCVEYHYAELITKIEPISVLQTKGNEYRRPETYIPTYRTSLIQLDCEEISQQLTIAQAKLFSLITQRELMNYVWGVSENINAVQNLLDHNSRISRWVITAILQAETAKEKGNYFKKFYRIAKKFYDTRNYNGCGSILEGLLDISVQSITELREFLSAKFHLKIRKFAIIFSPLNDYGRLTAVSLNPPFVPHLNYAIHRLKVIEDTMPTYLNIEKKQINFLKMHRTYEAFAAIGVCKPKSYDYTGIYCIDPSVQKLILEIHALHYEELNRISIAKEPARMNQTVLEMELAERDIEINQLRQQLKQQKKERARIIEELGLNKESLRGSQPTLTLSPVQVKELISLLAHERSLNTERKKRSQSSDLPSPIN